MTTERIISSNEIPLPAITICSPVLMREETFNFWLHLKKMYYRSYALNKTSTLKDDQLFAIFGQICNLKNAGELNWPLIIEDYVKILDEATLEVKEAFDKCLYQKTEISCRKIVQKTLTDFGFCFSFNLLDMKNIFNLREISDDFKSYENFKASNWSLEKGFQSNEQFPHRMSKKNQIQLKMKLFAIDIDNLCHHIGKNFLIYFHLPNEMMTTLHDENYVEFEMSKKMQIGAKKFSADESLRSYTPEQRRCYFEGERKLKFFASYTKTLCEFECLTNFTLKTCNCVKFSMPRTKFTKVCNFNDSTCLHESENSFIEYDKNKNSPQSSCNCLPPCNDIKYHVKYEKAFDFSNSKTMIRRRYLNSVNSSNKTITHVTFEFPSPNVVEEEKLVAYRLQDMIADCGGLSGLFLGFSILSIVDLFEKVLNVFIKIKNKQKVDDKICNESGGISKEIEKLKNEIEQQKNLNSVIEAKFNELRSKFSSETLIIVNAGD